MSLAEICAEKRNSVENGLQAATAKPSKGLTIVFEEQDGWRRLAIGRKDTAPSTDEWRIVSQHFGLPTGQNPQRAWRDGFMVLELTWREIQQPSPFDTEFTTEIRGQHEASIR